MKIFISYARQDFEFAKKLYLDLKKEKLEPWLDTEELMPGQDWRQVISRAIKQSSYFIALLSSNSVSKKGYVQKELKIALEELDEHSPNDIFIIPVRLDECKPEYEKLEKLHWVDIFENYKKGLKQIIRVVSPKKKMINDFFSKEDFTIEPAHLQEFRYRLKISFYSWIIFTTIIYLLLRIKIFPFEFFSNQNNRRWSLIFSSDWEFSLIISVLFTIIILILELYRFIEPGLYKNEKKLLKLNIVLFIFTLTIIGPSILFLFVITNILDYLNISYMFKSYLLHRLAIFPTIILFYRLYKKIYFWYSTEFGINIKILLIISYPILFLIFITPSWLFSILFGILLWISIKYFKSKLQSYSSDINLSN